MSHANIAFFIPHVGCPHQCSFCNQIRITGHDELPSGEDVARTVSEAVQSGRCSPEETEIAFFGGSFTAVDIEYQKELLEAASAFVRDGKVRGIRLSTRPDAIDDEILTMLKSYGVTSIELGAQSMSDEVLIANNRGHTAEDVVRSSRLIKDYGFSLGLQMMTGLYRSTAELDKMTAENLAELAPETMRIYPTLVMKDTPLEALCLSGKYRPMELETAVELCGELLEIFESRGIRVIRLGLHDSDEVAHCVAGPYHPAFAELCRSRSFLNKFVEELKKYDCGRFNIHVCPRELSQAVGQKKSNIPELKRLGYECRILADDSLAKGCFKTEIQK